MPSKVEDAEGRIAARIPLSLEKEFTKLAESHERTVSGELRIAMKAWLAQGSVHMVGPNLKELPR